jgi:hypothetical protein
MADEFDIPGRWSDTTITWVFRVRVGFIPPPVLRRFADSPTPHQNLVRAEAAAELDVFPGSCTFLTRAHNGSSTTTRSDTRYLHNYGFHR